MTDNFGALDALLDSGLKFTLRGKAYTIQPVDGLTGLWCQRLAEVAGGVHTAETDEEMAAAVARVEALPKLEGELTLVERMLGDLYNELIADGVHHEAIKVLGKAAYIWVIADAEKAKRFLDAGGRPESLAPNRAARRQSRATAGAKSTRKPASTSTTKSRKTAASPATARRSSGKTS